ncbi:MAG TPA: D-Ala-D-Ala carboxypeptidase family metallohydrolase [Bacteroidales bacterium]|nr:D-Ala-D-Ala carboxypeptidase family metallohydrolase [Bacteroidales bacterium]
MVQNIQFTPNFSLYELLVTEHRSFDEEQYNPPSAVIDNLKALCINILQPLRDSLGTPVKVNSGYRCPSLNKAIKGSLTSQHMTGQAADIIDLTNGNEYLFKKIKELNLPFDQMIDEFGFRWVHVSYDPARNRRDILQAVKDAKGKTIYVRPNV